MNRRERGTACAAALVLAVACGGSAKTEVDNLGGANSGGSSAGGSGIGGMGGDIGSSNPSCTGLAKTCGRSGHEDCCASSLVPGGTFYRSYDGKTSGYVSKEYPATVSDFRLDTYEITVGRFRQFVTAYSQTMIPQGAGKNPSNPRDTGWDAAHWNAELEEDAPTLVRFLNCSPLGYQTWTDVPGTAEAESRPLNCLSWYEAYAFCIWDGGRLPTEAEWNYAASGGAEQRVYPWGSTPPDASHAVYEDFSVHTTVSFAAGVVGSKSTEGDGKWGQADLAGNVSEWVQDWYAITYTTECDNCTETVGSGRVVRGGSFNTTPPFLLSSYRAVDDSLSHDNITGARCARSAP